MRADERVPRGGLVAFGSWGHAVTPQNVFHGLAADGIAQVSQGPDDAIVPPRWILLGQPQPLAPPVLHRLGGVLVPCAAESPRTSSPREVLPSVEHRQNRYLNNRAENSHQPTRQRERRMQ